jgi:hypothetical protein
VTDWESLTELVSRLGLLVDARDWPRLPELFTDQVDVDYSSLNGGVPQVVGVADLIAGWRENLSRLRATHHLIANHVAAIDGDRRCQRHRDPRVGQRDGLSAVDGRRPVRRGGPPHRR